MSIPQHTATIDRRVGRFPLWFSLLGGVTAWLIHFLAAYAIGEFACVSGWGHRQWIGVSLAAWSLLGMTLLTVLLALAAICVARFVRRRIGGSLDDVPGSDGVLAAAPHMAYAGWMLSLLSLVIILVQSIPIFYWLKDC